MLADSAWLHCPQLSPTMALLLMVSKGNLSLPKWSLGSSRQQVKGSKLPHLFPLVKSKCFGDDGIKRCCKPGHSFLRRVMSSAHVPWSIYWLEDYST
eukprot:1886040-Amphidinium_carterae.1